MAKAGRNAKRRRSGRGRQRAARDVADPRTIRRRPVRIAFAAAAAVLVGGVLWLTLDDEDPERDEAEGLLVAGANLYAAHCASCHGANLEGQDDWRTPLRDGAYPAPPHDASGHTWHHPDSQLFEITKFGGQASAPAGFESRMPGFEGVLSDAEIWAVLEFIKSRWPSREREAQARVTRQSRER